MRAGPHVARRRRFAAGIATGLDGWAENGGGVGNSVMALADPATAGSGAFAGVISTPYIWVWINTLVTLLIGCVLGIVSQKLTAAITPKEQSAATEPGQSDAPAGAAG